MRRSFFFQIVALHCLPQRLVDQRLIAALTRLCFEVFNEASIQQDSDAPFARCRLQSDAQRRTIEVCLRNLRVLITIVEG